MTVDHSIRLCIDEFLPNVWKSGNHVLWKVINL